jgi:hypothetical protein
MSRIDPFPPGGRTNCRLKQWRLRSGQVQESALARCFFYGPADRLHTFPVSHLGRAVLDDGMVFIPLTDRRGDRVVIEITREDAEQLCDRLADLLRD